MKLKNQLTGALLATTIFLAGTNAFSATPVNSASTNKATPTKAPQSIHFKVTKYNLVGFTGPEYINNATRNKVITLLGQYTGDSVTPEKINELRLKLQSLLNEKSNGIFTVNIPGQTVKDHVVKLNVNFTAGKVNWGHAEGYDSDNVKNSLPSLREGIQFIAGRPFIDERELTMAVENPLKVTQVQYDLSPNRPVVAQVNVVAPYGKTLRSVELNNFGSDNYHYLLLNLKYLNANLTGSDDTLTLFGASNLVSLQKLFQIGAAYSYPIYKYHQRVDVQLVHSSTTLKDLDAGGQQGLKLNASGRGDIIAAGWSYYLPQVHYFGYTNQLKVTAGLTFKRLKTIVTQDKGNEAILNDFYFLTPFYVGFNGKINPTASSSITFNATYNWFYAGYLGTSSIERLRSAGKRQVVAKNFEDWWKLNLSYSFPIYGGWNASTTITGQYSNKQLINSAFYTTPLKGRSDGLSGDSGAFFDVTLNTPNFLNIANTSLTGYAYYDIGYAHYNRSATDIQKNSSYTYAAPVNGEYKVQLNHAYTHAVGAGVKFNYKQFSASTSFDYHLPSKGNEYKELPDNTSVGLKASDKKRFSVYFNLGYNW